MATEQLILLTDTETTGLDHRTEQVIQIGALLIRHDIRSKSLVEVVGGFECKFMPDVLENDTLGKYNNFDQAVWEEEAIDRAEGLERYFEMLEGRTFGGQNPMFDYNMIDSEAFRLGLKWPKMAQYRLVAVEMFAHPLTLLGYIDSIKQEVVAEFLGLGKQTHDALDDVWQSVEIYRRLLWLSMNGISPETVQAAKEMPLLRREEE